MKQVVFYIVCICCMISCNNKQAAVPQVNEPVKEEVTDNFFPVTSFLKGQLLEIKGGTANPLKIVVTGQHTDSAWIKMEDIEKELAPFLEPVIDTANMMGLFAQKKFLDQTLNAFTFTYDPKAALPDSMQLLHWDVYVRPEDSKVTRVYLLKKTDARTQQQLTWITGERAKMVTLHTAPGGNTTIEKEETIKWKF